MHEIEHSKSKRKLGIFGKWNVIIIRFSIQVGNTIFINDEWIIKLEKSKVTSACQEKNQKKVGSSI